MKTVFAQEWYWCTLNRKHQEEPFFTIHPTLELCKSFTAENIARWNAYCERHIAKQGKTSLAGLIGKDHPVNQAFTVDVEDAVYFDLVEGPGATENIFKMPYLVCSAVYPKVVVSREEQFT